MVLVLGLVFHLGLIMLEKREMMKSEIFCLVIGIVVGTERWAITSGGGEKGSGSAGITKITRITPILRWWGCR